MTFADFEARCALSPPVVSLLELHLGAECSILPTLLFLIAFRKVAS